MLNNVLVFLTYTVVSWSVLPTVKAWYAMVDEIRTFDLTLSLAGPASYGLCLSPPQTREANPTFGYELSVIWALCSPVRAAFPLRVHVYRLDARMPWPWSYCEAAGLCSLPSILPYEVYVFQHSLGEAGLAVELLPHASIAHGFL